MTRSLAALLLAMTACLAGCAATSGGLLTVPLPAAARAEPDEFLLVTVRNEPAPFASRAGSTLRGYDGAVGYSVSSSARSLAKAIASDYGLREVSGWPIATLGVHCVLYRVPPGGVRAALLVRLAADPRIQLAQPLQTFTTSVAAYDDPYLGLQRGLAEMSIVAAHRWSKGDGVTVAVIDTGIDGDHPDLAGRVRDSRNFVDDDGAQFARDRHGTEVAGVIAAIGNNGRGIVGVAPHVELLAYKACWQPAANGAGAICNSFTLAQALSAAIDARADVINLSLVGPADPLLSALTGKATERGSIVVGAVPTTGRMDGFPAGAPGVLPVDMAEQGAPAAGALQAPGREVLTLTPEGHYDFATGSSLATANVSGTVALLRAIERRLTAADARRLLAGSTQAVAAASGPGFVQSINACAALATLLTAGQCPGAMQPDGTTSMRVASEAVGAH